MASSKKHLSIGEQVNLLKERGLEIRDEQAAARLLRATNYYRFSGYAREFQYDPRAGGNTFIQGATFERIADLIELDRELRLLFLEALGEIELRARASFAHEASIIFGNGAFYLDADNYMPRTPTLERHIEKIEADLRRPKQPTVERYRDGDDLSGVPIWVAIEHVSFGAFVKMCWYLNDEDVSKNTANALSLQATNFSSTLHSLSALRNRCAHHGQLWNRSFDVPVKILPKEKRTEPSHKSPGSYPAIIVVKRWLKVLLGPNDWGERVDELLQRNDDFRQGILEPTMK